MDRVYSRASVDALQLEFKNSFKSGAAKVELLKKPKTQVSVDIYLDAVG